MINNPDSKSVFARMIFALLMFVCVNQYKSQTGTLSYSVLQQPCNAGGVPDGSLQVTINGISYPIYVQYWDPSTQTYVYDTLLSNNTVTITNWSGAYFSVYAYNGTQWANNGFSSPPFTYTTATSPAVCPVAGSGTVTISGGTVPFTVDWMDLYMVNTIATGNPVSLPPGDYSIRITDGNGCVFGSMFKGDSINVYNQSGISATISSTTATCTNGTASITNVSGGLAPYTYQWSNGANTSSISGLSTGQYTVSVSDAQGCYSDFYAWVPQGITINCNSTSAPATCIQSNGSAIAFATNGTAPYSFLWSNGQSTQTLTNVPGGFYSFTAIDANGCMGNGYVTIATSTPVNVTYATTPSQCTSATGSATLSISGGSAPYSVAWNTSPPQSGITATGLMVGTYAFTVTDANGCVRTGGTTIPPVSSITGFMSTTSTPCASSNGSASLSVVGSAPPLTYLWNTGATASSISNLAAGGYTCTVTDANSCQRIFYEDVNAVSPVVLGFNVTNASCILLNDGSITAVATGGTAPYTYSWGSNTLSNIGDGVYYCLVTDANGCKDWGHTYVGYNAANNSCYCKIEGYAYEDLNGNCIQDIGENGINHVMISCSGIGSTWTQANGYYSFLVPTGSYTISENPQGLVNLAPCQNNNQVVNAVVSSGCSIPVNFGNQLTQVHDMKVFSVYWTQNPVPGNPYVQSVVILNQGTMTENNIQMGYAHDGQLAFQGSSPLVYSQQNPGAFPDWYSITSGFPTLAPGAGIINYNYFNTPTNIPLGTSVVLKDTVAYAPPISNWLNENSPWNNVEYRVRTVVASYDPNFKEVSPKGQGAQGLIPFTDTTFNYMIHFQNTGTYPAQLVVLKDTLDPDLDWSTLQPGWSNHDYVASIDLNGVLTFRFDNIWLPDSASNPLGSIGIVEYTVNAKNASIAQGVEIKNSVGIYFDYNAPVITNTTVNTYSSAVGTTEVKRPEDDLHVYPNPAGENVMLSFENNAGGTTAVELFDVSGKCIMTKSFSTSAGKNFINLDLRSVANGLYFVKVKSGEQEMVKKISLTK
jgi:hypothetical protein